MIRARDEPYCVRNDETDESDRPTESSDGTGQNGANEISQLFHATNIDTARGRPLFSSRKRIKLSRDPHQSGKTPDDERSGTEYCSHVRRIECPHRPARHEVALAKIRGVVNEHHHRKKNK